MIEFGVGIVALFLGAAILSVCVAVLRFVMRRNNVLRFVAGMDTGVYVEHGMTIDPQTGLVTPQQRPSFQAYQHLL